MLILEGMSPFTKIALGAGAGGLAAAVAGHDVLSDPSIHGISQLGSNITSGAGIGAAGGLGLALATGRKPQQKPVYVDGRINPNSRFGRR